VKYVEPSKYYYITVTRGMRGWFAVMIISEKGYDEPWVSSPCSYETREEAEEEAVAWAQAENIRYTG
jgi:hypothetical protein